MKSIFKKIIMCSILVLSFAFISACGNDNDDTERSNITPTFESFEIVGKDSARLSSNVSNDVSLLSLSSDENPFGDGKKTIEEKINEEIDLGEQIIIDYTAEVNEYIYAITKIKNPSGKVVSSISINGKRYTSNLFEDNSNKENIILKLNVGNEVSVQSYTLETIKYIDGSSTKDITITGNVEKLIKVGNLSSVTHQSNSLIVTDNSISFSFRLTDNDSLISTTHGAITAVLYDGDNITKKVLNVGIQTVTFDHLDANKKYQYAVVATYDKLDGSGKKNYILLKNIVTTYNTLIENYTITTGNVTNGSITVVSSAIVGDTVTVTATPNTGYELEELYYIEEGSSTKHIINKSQFTMPRNNITIYAIFEEWVQQSGYITFMASGSVIQKQLQKEGELIVFPKVSNQVYEWFFDSQMTEPCTNDYFVKNKLTTDINLYGKVAVDKYLTFNDVHTITPALTWNWSEPLVLMDIEYGYKNIPVGYKDVGWYTDISLDEEYRVYTTNDFIDYKILGSSIMIYSENVPEVYNINYVMNGGINNEGNPVEYKYGDNLNFLNPTKQGYVFDGWYRTSTFKEKIESTAGLFRDITLYAKFIDDDEVFIPNEYENPNFETGRIQEGTIETEHFIIIFKDYAYLPPWFEEYLEYTYDTLEEVTGLQFDKKKKITIEVHQSEEHADQGGNEGGKGGSIPASWGTGIYLTKVDLLGATDAILHELTHCLQYQQYGSSAKGAPIVEGFAQYVSYKALKYLEAKSEDDLMFPAYYFGRSNQVVYNVNFFDIDSLYAKPFEEWIRVGVGRDANGDYSAGFAFMAYLEDVYGSYTRWVQYDPEYNVETMISNIKKAYGDTVFTNFYSWLKNNKETIFDASYYDVIDYSNTHKLYFYPEIMYRVYWNLRYFKYNDLYLDIDEVRNYLTSYKGYSDENLRMDFSEKISVIAFDVNGNVVMEYEDVDTISLKGVSYVLLVGENTIDTIEINGYN